MEKLLRNDLFEKIVVQDTQWFDVNKTGVLISRMTSDTAQIQGILGSQISMFFRGFVLMIMILVGMFMVNTRLGGYTILVILPCTITSFISSRISKKYYKTIANKRSLMTNIANEAVGNIRTVKAFAAEDNENERFQRALDVIKDVKIKHIWITTSLHTLTSFLINVG
jgi:ABC-type multidrug transport system fused ATPase/permease subunit